MPFAIGLSSEEATLGSVGGKGWNLSRLSRAGFPVPPAFLITTEAYQLLVAQRMIAADSSGVLFTGDPLTGRRDETSNGTARSSRRQQRDRVSPGMRTNG